NENNSYLVSIDVYCINRKGLLVDISKVFSENNIDITGVETKSTKDNMHMILTFTFYAKNKMEVSDISNKIRSVENVLDIERA
ncbi:MAG: ACT domain-containing protein, partial [Lachnospiraceae bacterium]|nr:ACT domain-containing protein [Lachnospiraceae bacterium]